MCLQYRLFENIVGQEELAHYGETARTEQFLLAHTVFYPFLRNFLQFSSNSKCLLQTLPVWKSLKFVVWERVNPLPDDKILDWSKLKEIADDIFKCIQN